jgi:hypothetical protein
MTAPTEEAAEGATRLGREVAGRMRLPGPPRVRRRPARIGSIASSSMRFAAATARPIPVRRSLAGPETVSVRSYRDAGVAPPRWWTPDADQHGADQAAGQSSGTSAAPVRRALVHEELPARGLPRAVRRVPDETTYTPGGIVAGLHAEVANVRRMDATRAAGPMLMAHDKARLTAPARRSTASATTATPPPRSGPPPGNAPGNGIAPGARGTGRTANPGSTAPAVPASAAQPRSSSSPATDRGATAAATAAARGASTSSAASSSPARPAPMISRFLAAVRRSADTSAAALSVAPRPGSVATARRNDAVDSAAPVLQSAPSSTVSAAASAAGGARAGAHRSDDAPARALRSVARPDDAPAAAAAPAESSSAADADVQATEATTPGAGSTAQSPSEISPLGGALRRVTATGIAATLGDAGSSISATVAPLRSPTTDGPRPLRRMLGAPHALRPAARTESALTRPAGPVLRSSDRGAPLQSPAAAAVRRTPAPASTAAPTSTSPTTSPTTSPATSPHTGTAVPAAPAAARRTPIESPAASPVGSPPESPPAPAAAAANSAVSRETTADAAQVSSAPAASSMSPAPAVPAGSQASAAPAARRSTAAASAASAHSAPSANADAGSDSITARATDSTTASVSGSTYSPAARWTPKAAGLGLATVRRFGHGSRGTRSDGEIRPALSIARLSAVSATRAPALPALPAAGAAPAAARRSVDRAATASAGASGSIRRSAQVGSPAPAASSIRPTPGAAPAAASTGMFADHAASSAPPATTAGAWAARRLSSVAMPELLSTHRAVVARRSAAEASSESEFAIRTSAGARGVIGSLTSNTTIVPATVSGASAGTAPAALVDAPRGAVRRSPAASASAAVAPTVPAAARTATGPGSARPAARPSGPPTPAVARRMPTGDSSSLALRRSLVPAPPPISIRPAPLSGPAIPDSARDVRTDSTPAAARGTAPAASTSMSTAAAATDSASQNRSALADSTAQLFAAARIADPAIRRFLAGPTGGQNSGGSPMPEPASASSTSSASGLSRVGALANPGQTQLTPSDIDEIVARIIDKIEERVVDELERRGRRFSPGVF